MLIEENPNSRLFWAAGESLALKYPSPGAAARHTVPRASAGDPLLQDRGTLLVGHT